MIPIAMCIDDDSIVLMLNEYILNDQDFCEKLLKFDRTDLALNYFDQQASLPIAEQKIPKIIFLDINMPVMDGWEFLDLFTKTFPQFHQSLKFVILSSSINPLDVDLANKHPLVINFMPKPIGEKALGDLKKHEFINSFFGQSL
jgi:CheY-like chemotaxis protein